MINAPEELTVGMTVFLYPQTPTASTNVHRKLIVRVMHDPRKHWPMIVVEWNEGGRDCWELVHRDNIRKRSPSARVKSEDREGDGVTSAAPGRKGKTNRVRVMPGARKYQPTDEQMELF